MTYRDETPDGPVTLRIVPAGSIEERRDGRRIPVRRVEWGVLDVDGRIRRTITVAMQDGEG